MIGLYCSALDWKVPTSFIYGEDDWMDYKGAIAAYNNNWPASLPCEILRVPKVFSTLRNFRALSWRIAKVAVHHDMGE